MRKALWLLFALSLPALAQDPVLPAVTAIHPVPTLGELPPPESLRPCCAFGYDLHVRAVGIPIPVYQIGNVLTLDTLGKHHYNDSAFGAVKTCSGSARSRTGSSIPVAAGLLISPMCAIRRTTPSICSIVLRRRWARRGGSSTVKSWAYAAFS